MNEIIKKFVESLNKDDILTDEQIKSFESLGVEIKKMIETAKKDAKKEADEEAEKEADKKDKELEESFKKTLDQIDIITEARIKKALCDYRESIETTFNEEKMLDVIDKYLSTMIEEHLPEKLIIDYAKLDRYDSLFKTMRESLIVTDDDVQKKISESLDKVQSDLVDKTSKLDDAIKRNIEYKESISKMEAEKVLSEKVKDLPDFEAEKVMKHFSESTKDEIEEKFNDVLESIKSVEYGNDKGNSNKKGTVNENLELNSDTPTIDKYAELAERYYKTYN